MADDDRRDMQIPASYYKAKRGALVYSSVLIFVFFARPGSTVKAPGLDVAIPVVAGAALIWLAAAYYASTFLWEWILAKRLNTNIMGGGNFPLVDQRLGQLCSQFQSAQNEIESRCRHFDTVIAAGIDAAEQFPPVDFPTRLPAVVESLRHTAGNYSNIDEASDFIVSTMTANCTNYVKGKIELFRLTAENVVGVGSQLQTSLKQNLDATEALRTSFTRLATAIRWERRVLFYGWDLWVVGLLFLAATVTGASLAFHLGSWCPTPDKSL